MAPGRQEEKARRRGGEERRERMVKLRMEWMWICMRDVAWLERGMGRWAWGILAKTR